MTQIRQRDGERHICQHPSKERGSSINSDRAGEVTRDSKGIIQQYASNSALKFHSLEEMDQLLKRHNLPEPT